MNSKVLPARRTHPHAPPRHLLHASSRPKSTISHWANTTPDEGPNSRWSPLGSMITYRNSTSLIAKVAFTRSELLLRTRVFIQEGTASSCRRTRPSSPTIRNGTFPLYPQNTLLPSAVRCPWLPLRARVSVPSQDRFVLYPRLLLGDSPRSFFSRSPRTIPRTIRFISISLSTPSCVRLPKTVRLIPDRMCSPANTRKCINIPTRLPYP